MTWENQQPTEEGYYWYREDPQSTYEVVRVYAQPGSERLRATGAIFERHLVQTIQGEWAGPIPYPRD